MSIFVQHNYQYEKAFITSEKQEHTDEENNSLIINSITSS